MLNCVGVTWPSTRDGASETTGIYTPGLVQTQASEVARDLRFCLFRWYQTHDIILLSLIRMFPDLNTVHKTVLGQQASGGGPKAGCYECEVSEIARSHPTPCDQHHGL